MPINLRNPYTNETLEVDDNDLQSALSSGLTFHPGTKVQVVDENNTMYEADAEEAPSYLQQKGFRIANQEDRSNLMANQQKEMIEKEAADSPFTAFATAALSGGTFGISDVVGKAIGGEDFSAARKVLAEQNPLADIFGNVTGGFALGPTAVGKGITKIGAMASEAAAKKVAGSVLSRAAAIPVLGKPLAMGTEAGINAATQGAIYGAGTGISEAALGKPSEIAENFIRDVGYGGLFGGTIGGITGLAGGALSQLYKGTLKSAAKGTEFVTSKAATMALPEQTAKDFKGLAKAENLGDLLNGKIAGETKAAQGQARLEINELTNNIRQQILDTKNPSEMYEKAKLIKDNVDLTLRDIGNEYKTGLNSIPADLPPSGDAVRLFNEAKAINKNYKKLQLPKAVAEVEDAFRSALRETIQSEQLTSTTFKTAAQEAAFLFEVRKNLSSKWNQLGKQGRNEVFGLQGQNPFKSLMTSAQDATKNYGAGKSEYDVVRKVFTDVDPKYAATIELQKALNKSFTTLSPIDRMPTISYSKVDSFINSKKAAPLREQFGAVLDNYTTRLATPTVGQETLTGLGKLGDMFGEISAKTGELRGKGREVAEIMQGPGTTLDKLIQVDKLLGTSKADKFKELMPQIEQLEKIKGIQKASIGSGVIPAAIGISANALGAAAPLSYMLSGVVSGALNPYQALRLVNAIQRVSSSAESKGSAAIEKMSKLLTTKTSAIPGSIEAKEPSKWEDNHNVFAPLRDPLAVQQITQQLTDPLSNNPELQLAVQNQLNRGILHLANKLPEPLNSPASRMNPNASKSEPSKRDQVLWNKRKDVLDNPGSFIEKISNGYVPVKEEIETFNEVFPNFSGKLQMAMTKSMAESKDPIPMNRRMQMTRMFNKPLDKQNEPSYAKQLQDLIYPEEEQKQSKGGAVGSGNIKSRLADNSMSEIERITGR